MKTISLALTVVAALAHTSAMAETWTQSVSGGAWSNGANWAGGSAPSGINSTADFSTIGITTANTVNLDVSGTVGHLIFGDTSSPYQGWVLTNNSNPANVLTLNAGTGTASITVNNGASAAATTISAALAGTQGFQKLGTATLILTGNNTYSGTTYINSGTLQVGNNSATGNLSADRVAMSGNSVLQLSRSDTYTFDNIISGAGRIVHAGSGTLILTGNNSGLTGFATNNVSFAFSGNDRVAQGRAGSEAGYTGDSVVDSVFGAGAIQLAAANSTLQFRANGADAGSQRLSFQNMLFGTGSTTFTVDVDRWGSSTGTGKTIALNSANLVIGTTMNVTGGHGYTLELRPSTGAAYTLGGNTTGTNTINPTTANIIISGTVTAGTGAGATKTLALSGTSQGNAINGPITNGTGVTPPIAAIQKDGVSSWTLSGNNTYSGGTRINAGTLLLSGVGNLGTGHVTIASSGTLDITGLTAATFTLGAGQVLNADGVINATGKTFVVNGTFNPGSSPGDLDVTGNFTLGADSISNFEIQGTSAGLFDSLQVTGLLTLGGTLNLQHSGFTFQIGDFVDLFDWGTLSGTFSDITGTSLGGGLSWDTSDLYTTGVITVVPEPGSLALIALGGAIVLAARKRKRPSL